jgi:hypothetical protein
VLKSYFASIISEKGRVRIWILKAQKHADPDPQHCSAAARILDISEKEKAIPKITRKML